MRKQLTALILALAVIIPVNSFANASNVTFRNFIRYESARECAVEIEVTEIDGGLINGTESLLFDGFPVADLSALTKKSGYSVGARFLYASPSFAANWNLELDEDYDGEIADDDCEGLDIGANISYRGSFGNTVGGFNLQPGLSLHYSYSYNEEDDELQEVDLNSNSLQFFSSFNNWIIGSGPLFGGTLGTSATGTPGCSLIR